MTLFYTDKDGKFTEYHKNTPALKGEGAASANNVKV